MDETFDIIAAAADRMKIYTEKFVLDPERWQSFNPLTELNWCSVKFEENNINLIPKSIGIYAFVVKFYSEASHENIFPNHGFIMYGGITNRTLRIRYREYLNEKGKRVNIANMFRKWRDHLYFFYSEIPEGIDLHMLEKQFNDSVQPPISRNDFSADVKAIRTAAF